MRYLNRFTSVFIMALVIFSVTLVFSTDVRAQDSDCEVGITKEAFPDDGTLFRFTVSGDLSRELLVQPENTEFFDIRIGDFVTVVEDTPDGWVLRNINCRTNGGTTVSTEAKAADITCDEGGGQAFCTFSNTAAEAIPTLSQWSIVALVAVLGIAGFVVLRRRQINA